MAIDFKTALTISGVTVQPGYPALAGLTAGRVLRATSGTTVAFGVIQASDLPSNVAYTDSDNQFSVAQGIRAAVSGAAGLYVPWISGDALPTMKVGSTNAGNNQIAIYAQTATSIGVRGYSGSGIGVLAESDSGAPLIGARNSTSNANTNDAIIVRSTLSSGTPVAGFGGNLGFQANTDTGTNRDQTRIASLWSDVTDATRTSVLALYTTLSGMLAEKMRLSGAGQLLLRSTDTSQAAGAYFPWVVGDTLPAMVVGAGGTHSTGGITARSGTGLTIYAASSTGTPFFGERLSSTATNSIASLMVLKHTAATPASVVAGYGVGITFQLSSTTTSGRSAAQIAGFWIDPADATYSGGLAFLTANNAGSLTERVRITNTGQMIIRGTVATNASSLYLPTVAGDTLPLLYVGGQSSDALQVGIQAYSLTKEAIIGTSYNSVGVLAQMNNALGTGLVAAFDSDTAANTIPSVAVLRHRSTAAALANFGVQLGFQGKSSTTNDQEMAYITTYWTDPAHSTRTSILTFSTVYSGLAASAKMYLSGYGYLGLGVSAPAGDLHIAVRNQEVATAGIVVDGISGTTYAPALLLRRSAGTLAVPTTTANGVELGRVSFSTYTASGWGEGATIRGVNVTGGEARADIVFEQSTGATWLETMRLSGGKVGIGGTPTAKLHVIDASAAGQDIESSATAGYSRLRFVTNTRTFGWVTEGSTGATFPVCWASMITPQGQRGS